VGQREGRLVGLADGFPRGDGRVRDREPAAGVNVEGGADEEIGNVLTVISGLFQGREQFPSRRESLAFIGAK